MRILVLFLVLSGFIVCTGASFAATSRLNYTDTVNAGFQQGQSSDNVNSIDAQGYTHTAGDPVTSMPDSYGGDAGGSSPDQTDFSQPMDNGQSSANSNGNSNTPASGNPNSPNFVGPPAPSSSSDNILGQSNTDLRNGNVDMNTIPKVIVSVIQFLLGIAGTVSVLALIYHAVKMQLASGITGDSSGVDKAKAGMKGAMVGFVISILAWFLVTRFVEILSSIS